MNILAKIQSGRQLCEPMFESKLVPRSVAQMIHSGEKSGKLAYVIDQVSTFAEQELKEKIAELTRYVEPAMIIIIGAYYWLSRVGADVAHLYDQSCCCPLIAPISAQYEIPSSDLLPEEGISTLSESARYASVAFTMFDQLLLPASLHALMR